MIDKLILSSPSTIVKRVKSIKVSEKSMVSYFTYFFVHLRRNLGVLVCRSPSTYDYLSN